MNRRSEQETDRHIFADGNMSEVVRVGNSVIRTIAPWGDAAHQVLTHLEREEFPWSPRLLGQDEHQETLSFVPGNSLPADLTGFEDEALLDQLGSLIHHLHTALRGFEFAPGTAYVPMQRSPAVSSIVGHNDIGPWNLIVADGKITGLIDWDLVAPGTPEWDLAYAAWRFAPLYPDGRTGFTPRQKAQRIRILLDAYELPASRREGFVDLILQRMLSAVETVEILGRQRVPGFSSLYDQGLHLGGNDDIQWLRQHREVMMALVE